MNRNSSPSSTKSSLSGATSVTRPSSRMVTPIPSAQHSNQCKHSAKRNKNSWSSTECNYCSNRRPPARLKTPISRLLISSGSSTSRIRLLAGSSKTTLCKSILIVFTECPQLCRNQVECCCRHLRTPLRRPNYTQGSMTDHKTVTPCRISRRG